jgi:hypothetical protein
MLDNKDISGAFIGENSSQVYIGKADFVHGEVTFTSVILVYINSNKAYIEFTESAHTLLLDDITTFEGNVDNGNNLIKGKIRYRRENINGGTIAECYELHVGEAGNIRKVETILMGCYFEQEFTFNDKGRKITFLPSTNSLSLAKRTKHLNHTILEGSRVVIEHDNLSIDGVNQMLWVICWLLRPIVASEVYYKPLIINDGELIIYSPSTPSGNRFGMSEKILISTDSLPGYLRDGLTKWENLDAFDRLTIKDAGYVLANAEVLGYGELAIMPLFAAIERLGSKYDSVKSIPNNQINKIVKDLKGKLKETANAFFDSINESLTGGQKTNLLRSIANVKPYDDQMIQKLKRHLINSNWQMEIDFKVYKKLRDSIMHSGVWPKKSKKPPFNDPEDYPNHKSKELQDQMEVIMLIAVLDLVEFDGLVEMSKNGWRTYVRVNDVKLGHWE